MNTEQKVSEKNFSDLTKKERRAYRLEKHYAALQSLYEVCGGGTMTGKKLSLKLLQFENWAHQITTNQCNGTGNEAEQEKELEFIETSVNAYFNYKLQGFFINGDARGYALKIKDEFFKPGAIYESIPLHKDFGGYGILAPEINGNY